MTRLAAILALLALAAIVYAATHTHRVREADKPQTFVGSSEQ